MEMIREQNDIITGYESQIPQIEIDILMENVRKLYQVLKELEKRNGTTPNLQETDAIKLSVPVETVVQETSIEPVIESQTVAVDMIEPVAEPVHPEELLAVVEIPVEAPKAEIRREELMTQSRLNKDQPKPSSKAATLFDEESHTVADQFSSTPSLHDRLSTGKPDESIASKMQSNPVADLKKSIGINEKFALINELFEGDINAYNEAIEVLNSSTDEAAALAYLDDQLVGKYGWLPTNESYLKLRNLVERRY